ncbi:MAG: hypothetical protein HUJ86_05510 [Synergistes sp.]|nr:hypothetical protein [Synergistes sp.]
MDDEDVHWSGFYQEYIYGGIDCKRYGTWLDAKDAAFITDGERAGEYVYADDAVYFDNGMRISDDDDNLTYIMHDGKKWWYYVNGEEIITAKQIEDVPEEVRELIMEDAFAQYEVEATFAA